MQDIQHEHYSVSYDTGLNCIVFNGYMAVQDQASCQEMMSFVEKAVDDAGSVIAWDFTTLDNLSSSAQGQLYRYLISQQENSSFSLQIKGKEQSTWQQKFLPNAKKILPQVKLHFL